MKNIIFLFIIFNNKIFSRNYPIKNKFYNAIGIVKKYFNKKKPLKKQSSLIIFKKEPKIRPKSSHQGLFNFVKIILIIVGIIIITGFAFVIINNILFNLSIKNVDSGVLQDPQWLAKKNYKFAFIDSSDYIRIAVDDKHIRFSFDKKNGLSGRTISFILENNCSKIQEIHSPEYAICKKPIEEIFQKFLKNFTDKHKIPKVLLTDKDRYNYKIYTTFKNILNHNLYENRTTNIDGFLKLKDVSKEQEIIKNLIFLFKLNHKDQKLRLLN